MDPINTIKCPIHKTKNISFVCIDFDCSQKILCQDCVVNDETEHDLQLLDVFLEQIETGDLEAFYGNNFIAKQNKFNYQLKKLKKENQNFYEYQIDNLMNKISSQISQELDKFKQQFLDTLREKIDSIFNSNCVTNCIFKNRLREEIQKHFKAGEFLDINQTLIKLHNSQLEQDFAKEKLSVAFTKMNEEITRGLELSVKYFLSNIQECHQFLSDFSTLTKQSMKSEIRQNSQSKDKNNILQSRNSLVEYMDIQKNIKKQRQEQKKNYTHTPSNTDINLKKLLTLQSNDQNYNSKVKETNNFFSNDFSYDNNNSNNNKKNQLVDQKSNMKNSRSKLQIITDTNSQQDPTKTDKQLDLMNIYSQQSEKFTNSQNHFNRQQKSIMNTSNTNNNISKLNNTNLNNLSSQNLKNYNFINEILSTKNGQSQQNFKSKLSQKFLKNLTQTIMSPTQKQAAKKQIENVYLPKKK